MTHIHLLLIYQQTHPPYKQQHTHPLFSPFPFFPPKYTHMHTSLSQFPNRDSTSPHLKSRPGLYRCKAAQPPIPASGLLLLTSQSTTRHQKHTGAFFSKSAEHHNLFNKHYIQRTNYRHKVTPKKNHNNKVKRCQSKSMQCNHLNHTCLAHLLCKVDSQTWQKKTQKHDYAW